MSADFTPEKENYKILTPFKMQVLTNFPYIEADFDALTNYGLLCKVVEYLNNVIANENEVTEQVTSLYNAYVSLQNYVNEEIANFESTVNQDITDFENTVNNTVDGLETYMNNYFNNLDVQEEINNKLDAMALDGTLTNLIKDYVDPIYQEYETDINNEISSFKNNVNASLTNLNTKIDAATSGSPLAAASTSDMTDTTKIYVNTTDGYWYYYDGDSWEQGGVYQSSEVEEEVKYFTLPLSDVEQRNGWIKHSDGSWNASSATTSYLIPNNNIASLKVFLKSDTNVINGLTFYSGTEIDADDIISSVEWAGTYASGKWYDEDVPAGTNLIVVTSNTQTFTPVIKFLTDEVIKVTDMLYDDRINTNTTNIAALEYSSIDPLTQLDSRKGWIKHSDSSWNASDATTSYLILNNDLTSLRVFLKSDSDIINAATFYTGTEINSANVISSVQWAGNFPAGKWYDITIPDTTGLIVITSNTVSFTPIIKCLTNEIIKITDDLYSGKIKDNSDNIDILYKDFYSLNNEVLKLDWKYIYHFGMEGVVEPLTIINIPSQSIYDVRNAKNLGFKCIEANVHKTSDNKYVVTHGVNGSLGYDFQDLQGDSAYGVSIGSNTLADLQANYRYKSTNPDYRVPITTLEDFLEECRKCSIYPMVQYVDADELLICYNIMGDKFFMYGLTSRTMNSFVNVIPGNRYNGVILEWLNFNTKEEILARCDFIGKPYIYSMSNWRDFSENDLKEIIAGIHQKGCYISTAYSENNIDYLNGLGFDFNAVGIVPSDLSNVILNGKKLIFNNDNTVTWIDA